MATFGQNGQVLKRVDQIRYSTTDMAGKDLIYQLAPGEYAEMFVIELYENFGASTSFYIQYTSTANGFNGKIELADNAGAKVQPSNSSPQNNNYVLMPENSALYIEEFTGGFQELRFFALVKVYSTVGGTLTQIHTTS